MTTGVVHDCSEKLGLPPGSLIFVGEQKTDTIALAVSNYDAVHFEEKQAANIENCISYRDLPSTTWIHVCGLHRPDIIESLGQCYGISSSFSGGHSQYGPAPQDGRSGRRPFHRDKSVHLNRQR